MGMSDFTPEPGSSTESMLSWEERLGLAYCRFNQYEWDDLAGPRPEGFDGMPKEKQHQLVDKPMRAIEVAIGKAACSRAWWIWVIGESEENWIRWWLSGEALD